MVRISLKEAYDNRSVIKQIADLSEIAHDARDSVQSALDSTAAAEAAATAASAQASAAAASASATAADLARYKPQIDGRVDAIQAVVDSVDGRVSAANATAAAAQTSAATAETNAGSAVYTANQATAGVERLTGRIDATDASLAQARADISAAESAIAVNAAGLTSQDARIDAAVVRGAVTAGAADGHLQLTTDDGSVRSSAIPIASQIQAGLMNSQTFTDVVSHGIRLSSLEQAANIWYVTFPGATPTEAQIQAAYDGANPGHPQLVGYKVTDLDKGLTYLWNGSEWQLLSVSSVPKFSQGNFGTIKGASPNSDGAVVAESDGTGSVQGWSAVKGDISTLQSAQSADASGISALKGRMTSAEAQTARVPGIDNRLTAAESGLSSLQIAQQADRTDITALQTSGAETASVAAEAKGASDANATAIATLQDGVQGLQTRTGAVESSVAALQTASSDHGTRIGDLETASSDHGTRIGDLETASSAHGTAIGALQTEVAARVAKNADIAAGTKCKITYDKKGLVTGGANLSDGDIPGYAGVKTRVAALETASPTHVVKNDPIAAGTKCKITYDAKGLVTAGVDLVDADVPGYPALKTQVADIAPRVTAAESAIRTLESSSSAHGVDIGQLQSDIAAAATLAGQAKDKADGIGVTVQKVNDAPLHTPWSWGTVKTTVNGTVASIPYEERRTTRYGVADYAFDDFFSPATPANEVLMQGDETAKGYDVKPTVLQQFIDQRTITYAWYARLTLHANDDTVDVYSVFTGPHMNKKETNVGIPLHWTFYRRWIDTRLLYRSHLKVQLEVWYASENQDR